MQSWVLSPPSGWMTSWREGGLPGCHSSRPEKLFYCLSEAEKLSQFAAFFSGSACFKHPTPFVLLCYYFKSIWQRNCRLIGILQNTAFSLVKGRLALGSPGWLGGWVFDTMPKWPRTQENGCWLRPSDQVIGKILLQTTPDQTNNDTSIMCLSSQPYFFF